MSEISELGARGVTATIKYGKGYEEPWLVFRGTPEEVRADIETTFGIEQSAKLTLAGLVLNAAGQANAMELARVTLGAVAIAPPEDDSPFVGGDTETLTEDPWAAVEQAEREKAAQPPAEEPAEDPMKVHFDTIASISDVTELKRYWSKNQSAFTNVDLMAAYKTRGKELSK